MDGAAHGRCLRPRAARGVSADGEGATRGLHLRVLEVIGVIAIDMGERRTPRLHGNGGLCSDLNSSSPGLLLLFLVLRFLASGGSEREKDSGAAISNVPIHFNF